MNKKSERFVSALGIENIVVSSNDPMHPVISISGLLQLYLDQFISENIIELKCEVEIDRKEAAMMNPNEFYHYLEIQVSQTKEKFLRELLEKGIVEKRSIKDWHDTEQVILTMSIVKPPSI